MARTLASGPVGDGASLSLPAPASSPSILNSATESRPTLAVVVPTLSRPDRLGRCLEHLAAARTKLQFPVYVCDSTPDAALREEVRAVCDRYEWVHYSTHASRNVAGARNACARAAHEDLLVNVDDDLELRPDAIDLLYEAYVEDEGRRIVAGSVSWDGQWSTPKKLRAIGYGRPQRVGEHPDFVIGAFFLYPRVFAEAWPWNERIDTADDIFMGALWRSHGVRLLFHGDARALHPELPANSDPERIGATVRHQRCHIYALLFDALIANPSLRHALSYELLGFAASAKLYFRRLSWTVDFLRAWAAGHAGLVSDYSYLRRLVKTEAAPAPGE